MRVMLFSFLFTTDGFSVQPNAILFFVVPLAVLCVMLSGCGQKGPLFIPEPVVEPTTDERQTEKNNKIIN